MSSKKKPKRKPEKKPEPIRYIIGDDGDLEWLCPHGTGHSEGVHTCDGCCSGEKYKEWKKLAKKIKWKPPRWLP